MPAAALLGLFQLWARPVLAQRCVGDCNGDEEVRIDELLLAVNIALEKEAISLCLAASTDGAVTVSELVTAVNAALYGCPGAPTRTPNPTATGSPHPTSTPGASPTQTLGPEPPVFRPLQDQEAIVGQLFAFRAEADDANPGDVLTYGLGRAPAGMTIDPATGAIQWTPRPEQSGAYEINVAVHDASGLADETSFLLNVSALGSPPRIEPLPPQSAVPGGPIAIQVQATDPEAGDALTYSLLDGPPGMSIGATNGVVSWTPGRGDAGDHDVSVQVTDPGGLAHVVTFTVTVAAPNAAPVAADDGYDARTGETLSVGPPGVLANDSDPDGDPLAAVLLEPPANGTLALAADGSFDYTPAAPPTVPGGLKPVIEWSWTAPTVAPEWNRVMVAPAVADLDRDGTPEIVFVSYKGASNDGILRALSGRDGSEFFSVTDPALRLYGVSSSPAVGNLDGDPGLEIVGVAGDNHGLIAFEPDGTLKWRSGDHPGAGACDGERPFQEASPQLADLDGDGTPEIVIGASDRIYVFGADGVCRFRTDNAGEASNLYRTNSIPIVADVDLDGMPDIVAGRTLYPGQAPPGSVNVPPKWRAAVGGDGWNAIGNFDDDPFPEIVLVFNGNVYLLEHTGEPKWGPVAIPHPGSNGIPGGGPPTIADFDGDGAPEIGVAGNTRYVVFETDGTIKWAAAIDDSSSHRTGSTVFDFENDGSTEVVYRDEQALFIFRGSDGAVLYQTRLGSDTTVEFPVVADVDADGHAEIVAPAQDRREVPGSNPAVFVEPGIYVFGGADGNWVRARTIWNQHSYHVTNVLLDGSIPAHEQLNWLTPGLNNYRQNTFLPDEPERADRFTYRVSDGSHDSNAATVYLDVLPANNAPTVVSSPFTTATAGFPYLYGVRAVDPDAGDTLTFSLTTAPSGMTIDAPTGLIRWLPAADQVGDHAVALRVEDPEHFAAVQAFKISVAAPIEVPHVVGMPRAAAEASLAAAHLATGPVNEESHRTAPAGAVIAQDPPAGAAAAPGAAVALRVSLGPMPLDIDDDGDHFSESDGDCNDASAAIHPGAADPDGDGVDQDCDGADGALALVRIAVEPPDRRLVVGEQLQLSARAIYTNGTSRDVTAQASWQSSAGDAVAVDPKGLATAVAAGVANVNATLNGRSGTAMLSVLATVPGDLSPPVAVISAPGADEAITGPVAVVGTADDPNFLRYDLAIAPAGATTFTEIGGGVSPVVVGTLGTLDPTVLMNGQLVLRLTVADTGGNVSTFSSVVKIDGNQKIGTFTLAFDDLTVPLSGMPLRVRRLYDSRDKRRGDFGVGWRLDVQSLGLSTNRVPGSGWAVQRSRLSYGLVPTDAHRVSIVLPSGRVEQFDFAPTPASSPIVPFGALAARFVPRPGTLGQLEVIGNTGLLVLDPQPGPVELLDDATFSPYDPVRFRYTAPDRTQWVLTRAGVESVEDADGNKLAFGAGGIVHSAGRSVTMTRDALGRITAITGPDGKRQTYAYDANGDLESHTDAAGNVTRFLYDAAHGLLRIVDPLGHPSVQNEFDDAGRLVATTDANGKRYTFEHDVEARETVESDPLGDTQRLRWDARGNVTLRERTVTIDGVPTVVRERWEYDGRDLETAYTDGDGRRFEMSYDSTENLTRVVVDPGGLDLVTQLAYDAKGQLMSETDPLGHGQAYVYDSRGNPIRVTQDSGEQSSFVYDARGRMVGMIDPLQNATETTFDSYGNVTRQVVRESGGPVVSEQRYTYDANGRQLTETTIPVVAGVPTAAVTTSAYDGAGRLVARTDSLGNTTRYEYDAAGVLTRITDPLGGQTRLTYDAVGNLVRIDHPDGSFETAVFDAANRPIEATDAGGRTTRFDYDEEGRLLRTRRPDGTDLRQVWSPGGLLMAQIDGTGARTDYTYDGAGRLVRTLLPPVADDLTGLTVRPQHRFEYDRVGNLVAYIDPDGRRTEYAYDGLRRLIGTRFADGSTQSRSYDAAGHLTAVTDEEGRTTEYAYDPRGLIRAVALSSPGGGAPRPVTTFGYDSTGQLQTRTDALGRTTTQVYDLAGHLVRRILPSGRAERFAYDAAGHVLSHTDFAGRTIAWTYDARGRPVARRRPDGEGETVAYTPTGKRRTVTDAYGTWRYGYDRLDRLTSFARPDGVTLDYARDDEGRVVKVETGATTTDYAYDALGRLTAVTSAEGTTTYGYDPAGDLVRRRAPNGVVTRFGRDPRHRLTFVEHERPGGGPPLASFAYTLSPAGRRLRIDEADGSRVTYAYDGLDRLTAETRSGLEPYSISYEYDAVGNRTRSVESGVATLYEYDADDRLLSAGSAAYAYDDNGNLLASEDASGETSFEWDSLDRLTAVSSPSAASTFDYDVDGRRIASGGTGDDRRLVVDREHPSGLDQVIEERGAGGGLLASFAHGHGPASATLGNQRQFFLADGLGSTRLLTNAAGAVSGRYLFDAFGRLRAATGSVPNPYRFAGERFDAAAATYDLRARSYDPPTGRFLSRDPFPGVESDPVTFHPFAYARADPVDFTDPTGEAVLAELSLVQTIRTINERYQQIEQGRKFCRIKGQLAAVGMVLGFSQLAAELLVGPEGQRIATNEVVIFEINNQSPTGGERLIGRRSYLGEDLKKISLSHDLSANTAKLTVEYRRGQKLQYIYPGGAQASVETRFRVATLEVCLEEVGSVDLLFESRANLSVKRDTESRFGSRLDLAAQAAASVDIKYLGVFKTKIPLVTLKFGPKGLGLSTPRLIR